MTQPKTISRMDTNQVTLSGKAVFKPVVTTSRSLSRINQKATPNMPPQNMPQPPDYTHGQVINGLVDGK